MQGMNALLIKLDKHLFLILNTQYYEEIIDLVAYNQYDQHDHKSL